MKNTGIAGMSMAIITLAATVTLFTGCEEDRNYQSIAAERGGNEAPSITVSGFWEGVDSRGITEALNLQQNGAAVTGDCSFGGHHGTVSGTVSGSQLTFSVNYETGATAAGTITRTGNNLSGQLDGAPISLDFVR